MTIYHLYFRKADYGMPRSQFQFPRSGSTVFDIETGMIYRPHALIVAGDVHLTKPQFNYYPPTITVQADKIFYFAIDNGLTIDPSAKEKIAQRKGPNLTDAEWLKVSSAFQAYERNPLESLEWPFPVDFLRLNKMAGSAAHSSGSFVAHMGSPPEDKRVIPDMAHVKILNERFNKGRFTEPENSSLITAERAAAANRLGDPHYGFKAVRPGEKRFVKIPGQGEEEEIRIPVDPERLTKFEM